MNIEELISEIEYAFGRNSCPRGLRITIDSDEGDYPDVRRHFHHRDWWTCDARYLKSQDGAFTFMTEDAQIYFTPAYMIESIRDPGSADTVPETFIHGLTETILSRYTAQQLRSVIHFIQFHLTDKPWERKSWRAPLAIAQSIKAESSNR